jgi:hypothetical protein
MGRFHFVSSPPSPHAWTGSHDTQRRWEDIYSRSDPRVAEVSDVDTSVALLRMCSGAPCQIDSARRTGYG